METISEKIKSINNTLVAEINSANKEYHTEKITSKGKEEVIKNSSNIANYRTTQAIKTFSFSILSTLKEKKVQNSVVEEIRNLLANEL